MSDRSFEQGTFRRLNEQRKRRGRPPAAQPRHPVQLWLLPSEYDRLGNLSERWPALKLSRSHILGLGIRALGQRLAALRANMEGSGADLPIGVLDLESLYLLWDLEPTANNSARKRYQLTLMDDEKWQLADMTVVLSRSISVNRSRVAGLSIANLSDSIAKVVADEIDSAQTLEEVLGLERPTELDVS